MQLLLASGHVERTMPWNARHAARQLSHRHLKGSSENGIVRVPVPLTKASQVAMG